MSKKNSVFPALLTAIAFAVVWFAQPVFAGLYKWTDDTGRVHFTDDKSKIPRKFRTKDRLKKLRQLDDRSSSPTASLGSSKGGSGPAGGDGPGGETEKGILSEEEEQAVQETIAFFKSENAKNVKFKSSPPISPNYQRMTANMRASLPQKQKLIATFAGSIIPALKGTYEYLKKSEAGDQTQIKTVWKGNSQAYGYFRRILSEIDTKRALTGDLQAAIEVSNKKKEEIRKEEEEKAAQVEESKKTKQVKE